MVSILLGFQIIIVGITVLATHMIEHKFKMIQASLEMYCSKRVYKTKANIDFIESIIKEYIRLHSDTDEEPDLPSAINIKLHKECIGRFSYDAIKNLALKTRHMMWGVVGIQCLITWINQGFNERYTLGILFGSLIITIIMCLYGIIKGIAEKQEMLIDEITHYVKNVYPIEVKKQNKEIISHKISKEMDKNMTQKSTIKENTVNPINENYEESKKIDEKKDKESTKGNSLNANDIAQLLKSL